MTKEWVFGLVWIGLLITCTPLGHRPCSCHLLAQMFVCTLMGRGWRRSTFTRCRTTPSSSWCLEVTPGAEEVKTHQSQTSNQTRNVVVFPSDTCAFKCQLRKTSNCYSARARCTTSSSRRQRSCCLLTTTLIRTVKSCPTCCWTWRISLSWRAEAMTRTGLKVLRPPDQTLWAHKVY